MLRTGNTSQRNAYVIGIGCIGIIAYSIASPFRKMDKRKNDWEEKKRLRSWRKNNILYRILRFAIFYLF
jgi:hypothetical protein